jgi:hypothetical protein
MTKRVIVQLHPPLAMGAVGRVLKAIAREWPDATVTGSTDGGMVVSADPDLSRSEARAAVAARRAER